MVRVKLDEVWNVVVRFRRCGGRRDTGIDWHDWHDAVWTDGAHWLAGAKRRGGAGRWIHVRVRMGWYVTSPIQVWYI